jgi:hypothetical protein
MTRSGPALVVLGVGLLVIVAAGLAVPAAPPLYDGVVPNEPYRWLDPAPPGQTGGAVGATAQITVANGKSPLVAVATPETVPQAQVFAPPEGLTLPAGATAINVSIQPVLVTGAPAEGHIDGNVYQFSLTDQEGTPLTAPASARVSVVLRSTDPTLAEATVARYAAGSWQPLKTSGAGFGGSFIAVVTEFGDYALITSGPGSSAPGTGAPASAGQPSGSAGQPGPPADASTVPAWLLAGVAVVVGGLIFFFGYRNAGRSRREQPIRRSSAGPPPRRGGKRRRRR